MNRLALSLIATGLLVTTTAACAQSGYDDRGYRDSSGYYPSEGYPQPNVDRYGNSYGAQYDYARVVRVDPVIERRYGAPVSQRRCYTRPDGYYAGNGYRDDGGYQDDSGYYGNDNYANRGGTQVGRNVATVIGGILGAAVGSQIGGGSARYATAAVGSMVGGMAGKQVYESNHRYVRSGSGQVTVCDPEPVDSGYYREDEGQVSAYDVTYEYAGRRYSTRTDYNPGDRIRVRVDVRAE